MFRHGWWIVVLTWLAVGSPLQAVAGSANTVDVVVDNTGFAPASVTVPVGTAVRWTNNEGFHSVESCDGVDDPPQCAGVAAEGVFGSGAPGFPGWSYTHTFTQTGISAYFCGFHGGNETAQVIVEGTGPPPVPDGTFGSPQHAMFELAFKPHVNSLPALASL